MGLKIIVHDHTTRAEKSTREWFAARRAQHLRNPHVDNIDLWGISRHAVRYPIVCDDCGVTYWANDPYAEHPKCTRGRNRAGF